MAALIIACSDGRIADPVSRLLERLEVTDADRMFVPGGPLVLTRPGMERRVAMHCIADMVESYATRRIILVSHQDCYPTSGLSAAWASTSRSCSSATCGASRCSSRTTSPRSR